MKAVFVTGTDTGVGKTVVTGLVARCLLEAGYTVVTQKWVETGCGGYSRDVATHLRIMGRRKGDFRKHLPHMAPYTFKLAASPHLAARSEARRIDAGKIKKSFRALEREFDFVVVEGAGGALVPINGKRLLVDIAAELNLAALVVVGNRLGAINHTLLTVEALRMRKIKIAGIIFNNICSRTDKKILADNVRIIRRLTNEKVLGVLTNSPSLLRRLPQSPDSSNDGVTNASYG